MSTSCGWNTKAGMASHSDWGWTCAFAGKITVRSLENKRHAWALLRWCFTTKRRYIKCMHLFLYLTFSGFDMFDGIILRNECSISATGDAVCNTTLTEFSGVIQSPNFPYTYERQTSCAWVIETTRGNTINASFSQFDLQPRLGRSCFADYVEVRNRLHVYSPPLTPVDQWYGLRPSVLGQDRSQTKKNRSWSWSCRSGVVLWNTVLLRSSS